MTGSAVSYTIGLNGLFYLNSGSYGSPTWGIVNNIVDLDTEMQMGEEDASNRAQSGFKTIMPTLDEWSIEGGMLYNPSDTNWQTFNTSRAARTPIDLTLRDQAIANTGSQGPRVPTAYITKFGRKEPLNGVMTTPLAIKPGPGSNPPSWMTT
jgi:hypothetical protein